MFQRIEKWFRVVMKAIVTPEYELVLPLARSMLQVTAVNVNRRRLTAATANAMHWCICLDDGTLFWRTDPGLHEYPLYRRKVDIVSREKLSVVCHFVGFSLRRCSSCSKCICKRETCIVGADHGDVDTKWAWLKADIVNTDVQARLFGFRKVEL